MIRRAAYQDVVVVVSNPNPFSSSVSIQHFHQQDQQHYQQCPLHHTASTLSPSSSLSTLGPWDTNISIEHNNNKNTNKSSTTATATTTTFKVPIHLIKRSRAVLVKDLERLAPGLETIRTQRGVTVYSRQTEYTPDESNTNGSDSITTVRDAAAVPASSAAAASARSSHRPPVPSPLSQAHALFSPTSSPKLQLQQHTTFIPILDEMEDCIWYLFTRNSRNTNSLSSSSSSNWNNHAIATPITNGRDDHRLVECRRQDMDIDGSQLQQQHRQSRCCCSSCPPLPDVEDSKKELKVSIQGGNQQQVVQTRRCQRDEDGQNEEQPLGQELQLSKLTQEQERKQEEQYCYRRRRRTQGPEAEAEAEGRTVLLRLGNTVDDDDKGEGRGREGEGEGEGEGEEEDHRQQQTRTLLGGRAASQSMVSDGSRSRMGSTQTTGGGGGTGHDTPNNDKRHDTGKSTNDDCDHSAISDNQYHHRHRSCCCTSPFLDSCSPLSPLSPLSSLSPHSSSFPPHSSSSSSSSSTTTSPPPSLSLSLSRSAGSPSPSTTNTAFISSSPKTTTTTTMTPASSINSSTSTSTSSSSYPPSPCTVECWTNMIQLQEQLESLAHSLITLLDNNYSNDDDNNNNRKKSLRAMATAALETCARISITSTTPTLPSSLNSRKDIGFTSSNSQYRLLTPEATPVSTPVITATIRQPISPRGLASVSRTLADGSGSSGDGEGRKRMSRLSALILPGSIVSDLEQQQQQSSGSSSSSGGRRNDPLLQDTVSHFSSYCMNFPALLSSNNPTAATPTSISATPPSSPRTTTTTGRPATMPASTTTMMTGSAAPTTSGKKSKNPFLAMFGKSTTHTPSPLSPLQGPVSTSGSEGHAHLSSTGGKEAVPVPRKGKKASGDEDAGSKKRTSWFKPSTQRRRANTMVALPVSGPGESLNEGGVGSLRSIHRGSTFSTPSSSATSATVTASGPESSAPRASTTTTTAAGPLASRRFSASFHFNLRGGSQRPTLSTANNSNSSSSQSLSSGQHSPVSPSFPRSVQAQSTGSQQGRQYSYSSGQGHQHLGPSTTTATGSFFDSVSDDSDSDDDLPYQCQRQYQRQYQQQYQSQPPLTPQYQSARRPANHPTSQYYAQQQEEEAATARQQERRYHVYDSEDSETDEDEESSDDDSDEVEDDDEEERRHSSRQYQHQQQQRRQVNPDTLEGYEHRFEDAPPPPSYHSLIQSDATHAAAVATTSTTTSTDAYTYPHTTTIMLTGLSSSSSSSSTIITPTTATTSSPSSRHTVSAPILNQLLQLLHHFESHLLDNFKTPSFQPSTATSTTGTTTNDTATSNRRQAWLDRNPKTVASFAYLLIELQQTGILPTAMSPAWSSSPSLTPPTSSSSSTTVSRPLFEMSEQDWLSMTGNASTEADLAKAMVALEQNCHHGLDPARWRRQQPQSVSVRDAWVHQVQTIYVATTTTTSSA